MPIDLRKKMAELVAQDIENPRLAVSPLLWKEKYVVNLGETPWWEVEDPRERLRAKGRQWKRKWSKEHHEQEAERMRKWSKEHPGYAARWKKEHPGYVAEAQSRYKLRHNESYPKYHAETMKKWNGEHPECAARIKKKYNCSPKGKVSWAKKLSQRRWRSTDPESYVARVKLLHVMQESCISCKAPYKTTHQIDHIIALSLGGTDDWENLQPLCISCHKKKTAEDRCRLMKTNDV